VSDVLTEIRQAMQAALETIPGTQASGYSLSNPQTPCVLVQMGETFYHRTMQNGHSDWNMRVRVYVSSTFDLAAQQLLDRYIAETGDYSVKAVLEESTSTVWDDLTVESCTGYQEYQDAKGVVYLGAEWAVAVMAADN
jgi:hypothetical protein